MEMEAGVATVVQLVEFQVDVRIKKGAVQEKKGMCDVNLANVDVAGNAILDSGVPDAQDGDMATATLIKNPTDRTNFLEGTFDTN
jgi:hypothetical protein